MKVLLIAYHFPPDPSVGSVRAGKIARALAEAGHEVVVIAPDIGPNDEHGIPDIVVRRIKVPRGPATLWAVLRGRLRRRTTGSQERNGGAASVQAVDGGAGGLRRYLLSLLLTPDERNSFIAPAARAGLHIARREPVITYTTAPPFSVLLAGWLIRRFSATCWVAELRDPWTLENRNPRLRSAVSDRLDTWLRQLCVRSADHVVAVSGAVAATLSTERLKIRRTPALLIRNGIDPRPAVAATGAAAGPFRIGYFGHLYMGRDPRPFLTGLARVLSAEGCQGASRPIEVHFFGESRYYYDVSVEQYARDLGIGQSVFFHEELPHRECLSAMATMDLLLLFAQHQPEQVPNKLYEYLAARRPIFALVDRGGETCSMLERLPGHSIVSTSDPDVIAVELRQALRAGSRVMPDDPLLSAWSTETQMAELVRFITGLQPVGRRARELAEASARRS